VIVNRFELCRKTGCEHYRRGGPVFQDKQFCNLWCKEHQWCYDNADCFTGIHCPDCQDKGRPKGCKYALEHLMAEEEMRDIVGRLMAKR